jgi:hypothetical protein
MSREFELKEYILKRGQDILDILTSVDKAGREVTFFEYTGHGYDNGSGLLLARGGFTTKMLLDNKALIQRVFAPGRVPRIELQACSTGRGGAGSFLYTFHEILPQASIIGYKRATLGWQIPGTTIGLNHTDIPIPIYSGRTEFNPRISWE